MHKGITPIKSNSTLEIFTLSVLGCSDWGSFFTVPIPKYNLDARGYTEMNFNLTYQGSSQFKIAEIYISQRIQYRDVVCNHTASREITPPNVSLTEGDSF